MADPIKNSVSGKTARLLNRLPHFYRPEDLGKDFLNLYQTFGDHLESVERDLFDVLRAHHVQTAGNAGSKGFIAPASEHGDLDKLFALYLETLGGTSQLVSVNPLFTIQSFQVDQLLTTLYEANDPLYLQLRELLNMGISLENDALAHYRPVSSHFLPEDINSEWVFALLTASDSLLRYLKEKLQPTTRELLYQYEGKGYVNPELAKALAEDLNAFILKDPFLYQKNAAYFEQQTLPLAVNTLRNTLNRAFLSRRWKDAFEEHPEWFDHNKANLQAALKELEFAPLPSRPPMHDIIRFNRGLIDHAGREQWLSRTKNIPTLDETRRLLQQRFNRLLLSKEATVVSFFDELHSRHPDGADLTRQYAEDPLMLRRFLLESILPYEIRHLYRNYQERLQALINVLKQGAATRQGIKDIVAANFGLIGDGPEVRKAKELIQIREYDPEPTTYLNKEVALFQPVTLFNDTLDPVIPEVRLTMLDASISAIRNIRFIHVQTGNTFTVPVKMNAGHSFEVNGGELIINGALSARNIIGQVHPLPPRTPVQWVVAAEIFSDNTRQFGTYGHFDEQPYGQGETTFGKGVYVNPAEPIVQVEILSDRLTYGAFSVVIPWHIEGVTDAFAETTDHPRHLINGLVHKVKAAGVRASVSYLQQFEETHELTDQLHFGLAGTALQEAHEVDEHFSIDSRMTGQEVHKLDDKLRLKGVFGYTGFNSGNTFG
ncbi:MAG: hypothetical protein AAGA66_02320 [Bacteroidota bacterium]